MSTAPAESTLERFETSRPAIKPTAHWWHSICQGTSPGEKTAYCGAKLRVKGSKAWDGSVDAEDCVVCVDLLTQIPPGCPVCKAKGSADD